MEPGTGQGNVPDLAGIPAFTAGASGVSAPGARGRQP
jgi:hypothetical protein